jgi:SNF2 family DNA or RNA helicase
MPLFSSQQSRDDRDGGEEMLEHFISIENENVSKKDAGSDRDREARAYMKLKQLLAPFILRRLKCNVGLQGLPPKVRKVEFVPFDKSSRSLVSSFICMYVLSC